MNKLRHRGRLAPISSLLGALLPAAVLLAGCGGGSSNISPSLTNYRLAGTLDYSFVSSDSNALTTRIESFDTSASNFNGELVTRSGAQTVMFSGVNRLINNPTQRRFTVQLAASGGGGFAVGQVIPLALGTSSNIVLSQNTSNNPGTNRVWNSDGGTATVTSIGADSIALRLSNARFVRSSAFLGTGTFVLDGTMTATGLRVVSG